MRIEPFLTEDEFPAKVADGDWLFRDEILSDTFSGEGNVVAFTNYRIFVVEADGTQFSLPWSSVQFFQVYPNTEKDKVWVEVNDSNTDSRAFVAFRVEGANNATRLSRRLMWLARR